ncbi:kelch-like ECH-associated protein 1 isoform X1 [Tribolium madens]|uniref:kelch-like ECH-associated protein 1 isoform X1 n=1 Tax=Tribolium madens TaxID=41895 RepID=UPI001CF735F5|nr:kelch-like ECH-associated protein 1 isoform X1 [Tribolium madens]
MQQNYLDKPLEVNPENPGREITWYRREHNKLTPSNDITDCTFIINGDEIRVHKVILIWHSPVFKKMFSGEMASDTIGITDIDVEDFTQMLEFLYRKTVAIKSVLHAWSLFYIAHKYLLDSFGTSCTRFIEENLDITNLMLSYEYAEMYGHVQLQKLCLEDVESYIRGFFLEDYDYHMKPTSLATILKRQVLNILNNNELILGVLNWAVVECDVKNISLSPENIVALLESSQILQYLTDLEFSTDSSQNNLIASCCRLIKLKNIKPYRKYSQKRSSFHCKCRDTYKIATRVELRDKVYLYSHINVNRDTLLYGLVLVTEDRPINDMNNEYKGEIFVHINEYQNPVIISETKFCDIMRYEDLVYVPLSNVIYLESDKIYTIRLEYKNVDRWYSGNKFGSVVCNYMSSKLVDKKKKTIFLFRELSGSVLKGLSFYPV